MIGHKKGTNTGTAEGHISEEVEREVPVPVGTWFGKEVEHSIELNTITEKTMVTFQTMNNLLTRKNINQLKIMHANRSILCILRTSPNAGHFQEF